MAETKVINLEVKDNSEETAKNFNKVADSIENVEKSIGGIEKSTKGADGGIKKIGKGIKGVGLAFKAAGIGLIIAAFASLKEVFTQNQKVADALSTAFETISIVFNEVARVVGDVYDRVSEATGGFDALGKVLGGLLTLVLAPLKAAFFGIKLGVEQVQLAWEKSFFGDKDPATIKNLQKEIKQTQQDLLDVGSSVVKAGGDIASNLIEAVGEVGSFVTETAKGISDISVKAAFEQAKLNVEITNPSKNSSSTTKFVN
jgi:methyl-accepting chemotaxis protein